jgi:hypothetical protein
MIPAAVLVNDSTQIWKKKKNEKKNLNTKAEYVSVLQPIF